MTKVGISNTAITTNQLLYRLLKQLEERLPIAGQLPPRIARLVQRFEAFGVNQVGGEASRITTSVRYEIRGGK